MTGGFGEGTCQECHFEADVNSAPGRLRLEGVPEQYEAGASYPLTVTLVHPGAKLFGFELAARFAGDGSQAGTLVVAPGAAQRAAVTDDRGISYAHHLRAGTAPLAPDTARWQLVWTAPLAGSAVNFHAVGNAANDDDSPLGDFVYADSAGSRRR
jgi:hypothetical protein